MELLIGSLRAQDTTGAGGSGAASSQPIPETMPGATPSMMPANNPPNFSSPPPGTQTLNSTLSTGTGTGGSGGTAAPGAPPPTINVPGGYGFVPQSFTLGEGKLAKPRLRFSVSMSVGFDDNIYSAPTQGQPQQFQIVSVPTPGTLIVTPYAIFQVTNNGSTLSTGVGSSASGGAGTAQGQPIKGNGSTLLTGLGIPVRAAQTKPVLLRPLPTPNRRVASLVTNASLHTDMQFASPRTIFTMSLNLGGAYYAERQGNPYDENASVELLLVHKLTPRTQISFQTSSVYSPQPDITRVDTPTQPGSGPYYNTNSRLELDYQLSSRFQTSTTFSLETQTFEQAASKSRDFMRPTIGIEGKYQISPRTVLTLGPRYAFTSYTDPTLDSDSIFLLTGADLNLSKRLQATLRIGIEERTHQGGAQEFAPYFEAGVSYRYHGGASSVSLTSRYGLEEAGSSTQTRTGMHTSVSISHAFSPRLQANAGLSYAILNTTNLPGQITTSGTTAGTIVSTANATSSNILEQDVGVNLSLQYTLSPHISLSANYSFIDVLSTQQFSSYFRNQFFLGASYNY